MSAVERRALIEREAAALFAARGYGGASIQEIVRRAGVSPPVFYDHFASKAELYRSLLEHHYAELRAIWASRLPGEEPAEERVARSIDAWFEYVGTHPFAARLLFREPEGDPRASAVYAEVTGSSRAAVMTLFAAEPGAENLTGSLDGSGLEMSWVVLRGVLQGLANWWADHPEVPREMVVATAMNALWIGFDRASRGDVWSPAQLDQPG
jgi:AcrR family transcriptional regulator